MLDRGHSVGGADLGMDHRFENGVQIQQNNHQGLLEPAAAADLPAPCLSALGQVAVVQEDNSDSLRYSGNK